MPPDQMATKAVKKRGLTVAVTGATRDLGRLLIPKLEADPDVDRILAFDLKPAEGAKVEFRRLDLTRPDAENELAEALQEQPVDALYHLSFAYERVRNPALAHELEVSGSMQLLSAVARAAVPRLILPSLTMLYGAQRNHPALYREEADLAGCPTSRFVTDKLQVERAVEKFRTHHPKTRVIVLRFAPILGQNVDNPATRMLSRSWVPTLMGLDPLWQSLHEEDAAEAMHRALRADTQGAFNIVADEVIPLSGLVREAGAQPVPLPPPLARAMLRALNSVGVTAMPLSLLNYLHYSWVADGTRARRVLGFVPRYSTRDAAHALRGS